MKNNLSAKYLVVALTLPLAACLFSRDTNSASLVPKQTPIPHEYFGMHIHETANRGLWPPVPFGAWRLSDTGVVWGDLEINKGDWRFDRLDRYVDLAKRHDVDLLLPLGFSPSWASARPTEPSAYKRPGWAAEPRDMGDWRRYVRTVATRYKGRLHNYEIWNEPNGNAFYTGTMKTLVELTRTAREELKAIDPKIVIVSPSFVDSSGLPKLDEFLAQGGGRYVDVIGYHFYVIGEDPESMLSLVKKVRQTMARHGVADKPLWNTETGWLIANSQGVLDPTTVGFPKDTVVLSQEDAAAFVARTLVLSWAAGLDRIYWYAWDNKAMGFVENDGKQLKPVANTYGQVYRWMRDAVMSTCNEDARSVWVCELSRGGDQRAWLVWSSDGEKQLNLPTQWRVVGGRTLAGQRALASGAIAVGRNPMLLESDAWRKTMQF